jgi:hypothetical protein
MADEALAQFGVLIALETLESREAMIEFLEFSRSGYSDMQCAKGYFTMVEQGTDYPLATMCDAGLSGNVTHTLADSKGVWVYHMLRQEIGDEKFFGTLRGLIDKFSGRAMTLDNIRQAFIAAAPEQNLTHFFAQWLDRTGAPRIELDWSMLTPDSVRIVLSQTNDGEPFALDLELDLVLENGTTHREVVSVNGQTTAVVRAASTVVSDIIIDPDRDYLIWRPAYAAPPEVDGVPLSATAPWVDIASYTGTYHIEMFGMKVDIIGKGDELFVDFGDHMWQLYPNELHRFVAHAAKVNFKVENGSATGFIVELNEGTVAEGVRID